MNKLINEDYTSLLGLLKKNKIIKRLSTDNKSKLKKIHSVWYSFAIWEEEIKKNFKPKHRTLFISDLKSDLTQSIPLMFIGYNKSTSILLRSSIENILRHIYFFDHRIEFTFYEESGFYIKQDDMYNYLKKHPIFRNVCEKVNLINLLSSKYSELSEIIHGKSAIKNNIIDCLKNVKFEQNLFEKYYVLFLMFGNLFNFILCRFHEETLNKMDSKKQKFIFSLMDDKTYKVLSKNFKK